MLQLLVSKRARVPLGDGFLARRTAGPGLAGAYFYQIRTEQALFALETKILNTFRDTLYQHPFHL